MNYTTVHTAMMKRASKANAAEKAAIKAKKYLSKKLGLSYDLVENAPKAAPFIDLTPPRTAREALEQAMKKQAPNSDAVKKAPQQGSKKLKNK